MRETMVRGVRRFVLAAVAISAMWSGSGFARGTGTNEGEVIQRVLPGVVTIFVRKPSADAQGGAAQASADTPLGYGHGAGFVIDPDGLIVTNRHNVQDARQLIIGFSDGTYALGSVVGAAEKIDLAVLRVNVGHKLTALSFADSRTVRVGDPVLAIGNPLGVGTSVSAGIVSALNRDIKDSAYDDFIQTDAAINHGNSGGPLINEAGQVIGMNSDIFSSSGGSMGLGFALASNDVQFLADRLVRFGRIKAGWIGVDLQDLSPAIAFSLHEPKMEGAVVTGVNPGSPALAAGITEGDVIQRIDSVTPQDARDAERMLAFVSVGATAHLAVWHEGRAVAVDVTATEYPAMEAADNPAPLLNKFGTGGLKLAPLTDEVRQSNDMAPGQPGVLVAEVPNNVFTGKDFLLPGDVVLRVQQTPVAAPEDVDRVIAQAKGQGMVVAVLLVQRRDVRSWVPLLIGEVTAEQEATLTAKQRELLPKR
jgi:serine protease Do